VVWHGREWQDGAKRGEAGEVEERAEGDDGTMNEHHLPTSYEDFAKEQWQVIPDEPYHLFFVDPARKGKARFRAVGYNCRNKAGSSDAYIMVYTPQGGDLYLLSAARKGELPIAVIAPEQQCNIEAALAHLDLTLITLAEGAEANSRHGGGGVDPLFL